MTIELKVKKLFIRKKEIIKNPDWEKSVSWNPLLEHYRHKTTNAHAVQVQYDSDLFQVHIDKHNPHNFPLGTINHIWEDWEWWEKLLVGGIIILGGYLALRNN